MSIKTKSGFEIETGFIHPKEFDLSVNLNRIESESVTVIVNIENGIDVRIDKVDIELNGITKKEQKEICNEIIKGIKTHKILLPIFIGFELSFDECSNNKKFHDWEYDWDLGKR